MIANTVNKILQSNQGGQFFLKGLITTTNKAMDAGAICQGPGGRDKINIRKDVIFLQ